MLKCKITAVMEITVGKALEATADSSATKSQTCNFMLGKYTGYNIGLFSTSNISWKLS